MSANNEIEREAAFTKMLQALVRAAGHNHNTITNGQLKKAFEGMNLSEQQLQTIKDYLTSANIGIEGESNPDPDNNLDEADHDYLEDYKQLVAGIEQPEDGVFDAIKINAMAGDKPAQERLIELMLSKVVDIARLYANQGVYMEDLIGIGNEELTRSVRLLGPLEGPQDVEPFLAERIMNAMEDLIESNVHEKATDADAAALANKVKKKADALADELGHKVTVEELAGSTDLTEDEILDAIRLTGNKIETIDYKQ